MNEQIADMPPVMILCGGYGTRIRDVNEQLPKPMVPIGPQPILWHIMKIYSSFGVKRFILCLGYKRDVFIDYFLHYREQTCDITIKLKDGGSVEHHTSSPEEDWEITLADTGHDTATGGRVFKAFKYVPQKEQNFFLTYGDAVSDIDIGALYRYHLEKGKSATITAVHPAGRFGEISLDENAIIKGFQEKPQTSDGYVNGGFMVVNRDFVSRYMDHECQSFEGAPLQNATKARDLAAYCHDGFWQCMDTAREHHLLNDMWNSGSALWSRNWEN